MDIEKEIYSEKEYEKIEELRRKNVVDKINKENSLIREEERKEWRKSVNTKTKILNIGVRIRKVFKEMGTRQLLSEYRRVRKNNIIISYWDDIDNADDSLKELELQTELSQREHVETDKSITKKNRQLAAKKNKRGRGSHKKK